MQDYKSNMPKNNSKYFIAILLVVLNAIAYRFRGGGFKDLFSVELGTQLTRVLFWSLPTAFCVAGYSKLYLNISNSEIIILSIGIFIMAFVGLLIGHGAHMRSREGIVNEPDRWEKVEPFTFWLENIFGKYDTNWPSFKKELFNYIGMSFINTLRLCLFALVMVWFFGNIVFLMLPFALFPAYYLAYRIPSNIYMIQRGTELGEFLTGLQYSSAIMFILTIYTP